MSIQSLGGRYGPGGIQTPVPEQEGAREALRQRRAEAAQGQLPPRPQEAARAAVSQAGDLPAEAPPGTDPQLWSVLTSEERRFFAQARAMGPLTYSRGTLGLAELALQRGGRLDVRV